MNRKFTRTGLLLPILFLYITAFSQPSQLVQRSYSPPGFGPIHFYEFRPENYGNQLHPLILFLHGAGEHGDGSPTQLPRVLNAGIPYLLAHNATMKFGSDAFVVLAPQDDNNFNPGGGGSFWKVLGMLKYAKDSLHIDTNRIYITGLSMGGQGTWGAITYDTSVIKQFAAAAPIAAPRPSPDGGYCNTAAMHMPIWAFHNTSDPMVDAQANTQYILDQIGGCTSPAISPTPRVTYYSASGHGGWDQAYDTLHPHPTLSYTSPLVSNATQDTINLYEWFLQHSRQTAAPPHVNQPPVADAGSDITITLPTDSVTLNGSASHDSDGTITTYAWTKISGGSATITSPSAASTKVTGLAQGTYQFQLTVTDDSSATAKDTIQVTVNAAPSGPYYGMDSVLLWGRYALVKRPTEDPSYTTTKKYPLIIEIPDQYEYADQAPAGVTALLNSGTPKLLKNGANIYPDDPNGNPIYYIAVKYQPSSYNDLTIPDGFTQMWDTIMARYPIDTAKNSAGKYKHIMLVGVEKGGATVFNFVNWNPNVGYGGVGSYRALNLKNIVTSASHPLQGWNDTSLISPTAFARMNDKHLKFFEANPPKNEAQNIYNSVVAYSNASVDQFILTGLTDSEVVDSLYSPYGTSSNVNIYYMLVDDTTTSLAQTRQTRTGAAQTLVPNGFNTEPFLSVYPNPVRDMVSIFTGTGVRSMELYSTSGKRLAVSITPGSTGSYVQLNMVTLAKGIYFLHITTTDGTARVIKLLKQ